MDGSLSGGHTGRPIKRGRGANAAGASSAFASSSRGRGGAALGGSSSFKRKLAGTPLFRPDDGSDATGGTSEDSGDDLPDLQEILARKAAKTSKGSKLAKDDSLYDAGAEKARKTRFETVATENRYLQLKPLREKERREAIASGLIPDPLKPQKLDEAITFEATCTEMCPEFEREEREYQKNVDRWEMTPGTNRIDRQRAVKAFHRPAAGNDQPLPSDVRPPEVLKRTLDYLFHDIIAQDPDLADSHPFLRDRTRAIRQDFTLQNDRGSLAIECHERIARYHILCLHVLRESENFSESQELEQLRKVLQSLNEFYEDARHEGRDCPHEAEFRAYYLITHLRDSDTIRQVELLPREIFSNAHLQAALRLHALAQRNNETRGERGRRPANSEASLNAFSRFFKAIARDDTPYLLACLAETHFTDIRRGALVCLRKAYMAQHPECPMSKLTRLLGCDDNIQCAEIAEHFGFAVSYDAHELAPTPIAVILHRGVTMKEYPPTVIKQTSHKLVGAKQGDASIQSVIDGEFYSSHVHIARPKKHITKKPSISRRSEKSTSPRASLKIPPQTSAFAIKPPAVATPPISVPSSPSLANKKAPLAPTSKGLNARASAFQPSSFGPPSPAALPMTTAPAPVAPRPASLNVSSVEPFVQPKVSPALVPSPTAGQSSGRQSQQSLRHSSASIVSRPAVSPVTTAPGKSSVVDVLAGRLLDVLLQDCFNLPLRNIAADGLGQAHAEQRAMLDSERQRVVDTCAGGLLESLFDAYGEEAAQTAAFQCICDRRCLKNSFGRWQRSLVKVRAAKVAKEARKRKFDSLSTRLGASSHSDASYSGSHFAGSPELSFRDLEPDPFIDDNAGTMQVETSPNTHPNSSFWLRDTLGILICDLANKTFSTFRISKPPQWTVLVVVPSLTESIASWYRCKLGMEPSEDQRTDRMPHVEVEYVLLTPDDLHDEDLQTVGLVIMNFMDNTAVLSNFAEDLEKRLLSNSRYQPKMLQIDWKSGISRKLKSSKQCLADMNDSNAGLVLPLTDMLQQVNLNNSVGNRLSASQVASCFLEIWRSCSQTLLAAVQTNHRVLRDLPEHIKPFIQLPEDADELLPPTFEQASSSDSLTESMQSYLERADFQASTSLRLLRVRLKRFEATPALATELCDTLARMVLDNLSVFAVDKEATLEELQTALLWWKDTVVDQTADLLQEIVKLSALPAKKRQREYVIQSTDELDDDSGVTKRVRASTSAETKAWIPERLDSLNALVAQTRALLAEK